MQRLAGRFPWKGALLFGSRVRGMHGSEGDADVAVLLSEPRQPLVPTKFAMAHAALDVLPDTCNLIQPKVFVRPVRRASFSSRASISGGNRMASIGESTQWGRGCCERYTNLAAALG